MSRAWRVWVALGVCGAVLLGAVGWLSVVLVRTERDAAAARRYAATEEQVRLALWRAEARAATLITLESARPAWEYVTSAAAYLSPAANATNLALGLDPVRSRFEYPAAGIQSEQKGEPLSPALTTAADRLAPAGLGAAHQDVLRALLPPQDEARVAAGEPAPQAARGTAQPQQEQFAMNAQELEARSRAVQSQQRAAQLSNRAQVETPQVQIGALAALWLGDDLVLARRVQQSAGPVIQGALLDWPALERLLAAEIADLFPQARFEPLAPGVGPEDGRRLAALPVRLVPGPPAQPIAVARAPLSLVLGVTWGAVLLALLAVLGLVIGIVVLSERRAAFVSAVTHELRTPLTTFRLYTDLLSDARVSDETKRRRYLDTLRNEAVRLGHLIENVLAFARLERGRHTRTTALTLGDLLAPLQPRLADRAAQADFELTTTASPEIAAVRVLADPGAVEQILLNLADNACKYAAAAERRTIELTLWRDTHHAGVRVRDFGPGVRPEEAGRLFRPFHKSARDAAHSAPGVGLGLALSRRLARDLGGDLRHVPVSGPGACFELSLRGL